MANAQTFIRLASGSLAVTEPFSTIQGYIGGTGSATVTLPNGEQVTIAKSQIVIATPIPAPLSAPAPWDGSLPVSLKIQTDF